MKLPDIFGHFKINYRKFYFDVVYVIFCNRFRGGSELKWFVKITSSEKSGSQTIIKVLRPGVWEERTFYNELTCKDYFVQASNTHLWSPLFLSFIYFNLDDNFILIKDRISRLCSVSQIRQNFVWVTKNYLLVLSFNLFPKTATPSPSTFFDAIFWWDQST